MAFKEIKKYTEKDKRIRRKLKQFSNDSWQELEDIWPANLRIGSEAYKVLSVVYPAFRIFNMRLKQEEGQTIRFDEFMLLFWFHRVEDAKENVCLTPYYVGKPLSWNQRMLAVKQSRLFHMGLVENIPIKGLRLYRVTAKGKQMLRNFVSIMEQAHKDVKFLFHLQPEDHKEKVNKGLKKYFELGGLFMEDLSAKDELENDNSNSDNG